MALDPILWAMKDAPVADVEEWAVLTVMAESADDDGCNAFQSTKTIARLTKLATRTVQRRIDSMVERGLIGEGDQSNAQLLRIPGHLRPVNYDLLIPFAWFPNIERINDYRAKFGRDPITPDDRPPLGPAPEKRKRKDAGVKRSDKDATQEAPMVEGGRPSAVGGDYKSPPVSESSHDFQTGGGDYKSGEGRQEVTQTSPSNHPVETTPVSSGRAQPTLDVVAQPTAAPVGAAETSEKPEPKKSTKKGTRIPEPFEPTEDMIAWARENTPNVGTAEHEKFCDYWRGVPGQRGVKLDWLATWRNWMRKADEEAAHRRVMQERRAQGLRRGYDDVATWGKPEDEDPESETLTDDEVNIVFTVPAYINSRGVPVNITNGDIVAAREYDAEGNVIPLTAEKYHQIAARKAGEATGTHG